ncbi:MAG: hypothetical protein WD834_06820 [Actinomycetota bacterium]
MWKLSALLAATMLTVSASSAAAAEDVIATAARETDPAASTTHIAWTVVTRRGQNVYAKPLDGSRFRVNAQGMNGATGGIDGTTLVYQEYIHEPDPVSDLHFLDLESGVISDPPAAVNTGDWEHSPGLSGDKLLFGRELIRNGDQLIVLFDLVTEQSITLARVSPGNRFLRVGQVNGNFVTWARDTWRGDQLRSCDVFLHDIAADETTRVPNRNGKCQYAPSVDPSGTVYFGRSGFGCGVNAAIMRYPVGGNVQRVERLSDGTDFANSFAVDNGDGTTTIYFDPARCDQSGDIPSQDIQKVVV